MVGMIGAAKIPYRLTAVSLLVLLVAGCSLAKVKAKPAVGEPGVKSGMKQEEAKQKVEREVQEEADRESEREVEVSDLQKIPQDFRPLPALEGKIEIPEPCRDRLLAQFKANLFAPWTTTAPFYDPAEAKASMRHDANNRWYGVNKRRSPRKLMRAILENCDLDHFPSRSLAAIAVAPGHLRGLPTPLPLYSKPNDEPFDMLAYPQVKLNEPLRVLHCSRDGAWVFVETPYSNGWIEKRDVALVDKAFVEKWMEGPHLVITSDLAAVSDGRDIASFQCKTGTLLRLAGEYGDCWEVDVASAGEEGIAQLNRSRISRSQGAPFPIDFTAAHIASIGNQLMGQPYGWGELYDLRDCSSLLRDFFIPFGIWLPRTSGSQIASVGERVNLKRLPVKEKEEIIKKQGIPFLTLLQKPGHIMLYVGEDSQGRPLVFHASWSVKIQSGQRRTTGITGVSGITTLWMGKELGLVPGSALLERLAEMGTITARCD